MRDSVAVWRKPLARAWARSVILVMALGSVSVQAEVPAEDQDCQAMADDGERLRCYDLRALRDAARDEGTEPVLTRRHEKERDLARRAFAIIPHRPNYLLFSHMAEPNVAPFLATDPQADLQHQEIKFQISLRVPMWNNMLGHNGDLWFAYTQQSWWQAFNWERSAPFRETNFEPELGFSWDTDFTLLGLNHRRWSVGFVHQSNGRGDQLSRSWNRLWASFELERGRLAMMVRPWWRIPEAEGEDDNPEILDHAGRAELRLAYRHRDQVFSLMLRNNLRDTPNRSGYEINWSFPFSRRIKGLVQFYNGYGESLIDHQVRTRRVGLGVLVEDWL